MKLLTFKRPFYLTTLIVCGCIFTVNPGSVIAKEKEGKQKTITTLSEQELAAESGKKEKKSTETTGCVPKKITTLPDQELEVTRGKGVNVIVKVKCKGDAPAVGVTVGAATVKGKKAIELSPASAVTDHDGKAVFTVTGNKKTEEELAEIKFSAEGLAKKLAVKVSKTECKPASIKIEPEKKLTLEPGKSSQVTVKVKCENGSPAPDAKVDALVLTGSGKANISPSAVLTDASGLAVFTVKGVGETKKEPATIRFAVGELQANLDVKVGLLTGAVTETTECVPKKIITLPDQELMVERGKDVNVTVKVKCKGDVPATGVTVAAVTLKGKKAIELSPASAITDTDGKATFTVTGNKIKEEELAEIKFTAGELTTRLAVRVSKTECKPVKMKLEPEQKLTLEPAKNGQVVVKILCENGSPAVDAKVDALVQSGSGKIEISPSAQLTNASGKAVFTVTALKETKKEPATIRFVTGDLISYLNVKVQPITGEESPKEETTPRAISTPEGKTTPQEVATPK